MTIAQEFARFAKEIRFETLPAEVIEKAKTCLLHGISVGLAGYDLEPGKVAKQALRMFSTQGSPEATMIGDGYKASVVDVVYATSAMFHSRYQEDTHGTTHAGTVCNPIALAIAENRKKSGRDIIVAIVAGYEIAAAMGMRFTEKSNQKGFRATPIYALFGGVTTAGLLMDLSEEELVSAYGFALTYVSGPICPLEYMEGRFEPAHAARSAVMAACMAKSGGAGNPACMESGNGFFRLFTGEELSDTGLITAHLGKTWEIMNVTVKLHPCCAFNQTHVLNVLALMNEHPVDVTRIKEVTVIANPYEAGYRGLQYRGPYSSYPQTCNSTPFVMSVCLNYGKCTIKEMTSFQDEKILRLIEKIHTSGSEDVKPLCSRIRIELEDGTVFDREMTVTESFYSPLYKKETEQVRKMANEIAIPPMQIEKMIEIIRELDRYETINDLIKVTTVPGKKR